MVLIDGFVFWFRNMIYLYWYVLYGTLKRVVWYLEEGVLAQKHDLIVLVCIVEGGVVLWREWCDTLKRVLSYFVEGGVVLWGGWCGTLRRVVWYFEEGGVLLWRGWCGTLKRVVWYFEKVGVVLWRWWCGTLKRLMCYFEDGGVVLWRGLMWYSEVFCFKQWVSSWTSWNSCSI